MFSLGKNNCLLLIVNLNFNIHTCNILFIYLSQHYEQNFHAKNIIWLEFTINYSLFQLLIIIDDIVLQFPWLSMLYVCIKGVYKCNNKLVCKAVRLAFSCQTSAISLLFILIGLGSVMELYGPLVTTVYVKCLFLTMKYAPFRRWVVRIVKVRECYECQKTSLKQLI